MAEFPSDTFGFVPDWLPDLVGRSVMLAALIEVKVDAIVMNLSGKPQPAYAGGNADGSLDRARKLVSRRIQGPDQERLLDLLNRVGAALRKRNAIVHSVWPDNSRARVRGWRTLPKSQREPAAEGESVVWTDWTELDEADLEDLQATLQSVVDELVDVVALTGSVGAGAS